jgi:hypothetical protein
MRKTHVFSVMAVVLLMLAASSPSGFSTATLENIRRINEAGFGKTSNKYAFSMTVFDGSLFVGTLNMIDMADMAGFFSGTKTSGASEGAEVWRYDEDGTWTQVVDGGLGNPHNIGVRKLTVAKGCIYGVTANHNDGMEVWRSCDGESWLRVAEGGFGDPENTSRRGLGVYKDYIYAGTEDRSKGAQLYRSKDGENWERVAHSGISDKNNWWLSDFMVFKGRLYMGTLNVGGMQLYRTRDGLHFEKLFSGGIDKFTNTAAMKLYVYNDKLYVTTMDFFQGYDLYMSENGVDFQRVIKEGLPDSEQAYLWQLIEYDGRLYGGTYHHRGVRLPKGTFALLSTEDGKHWEIENRNGFGNPYYYGIRSVAVYNGELILGTASAKYGCKIFAARSK